ncbi:C4-type zinc ribbon domain-containing protein [Desulfococcaceae bacterium HSG8]|nr:C4-type zinc ribbon domain-containing protein [Desulfococcaceae bacterium HSG8]
MKEQIEILVKLQNIETETGSIRIMLDGLPDKLTLMDTRLSESEQLITDEISLVDELKKNYRALESDVKTNLSRIEKSQENLRVVKTNKEYQALLKEIEDFKKKNSKIEDEMITSLDRIEETEKNIAGKKEEYSALEKQLKKEKDSLKREATKRKKKLAQLEADRNHVSEKADPALLKKFTQVRERINIAIVPVIDYVCGGCNMNIPPQLYNDLHRWDSLEFCPHCQRIIYWEKQEE